MYDLNNKILFKESQAAVGGFSIKGLGIVFENKFDKEVFEKLVQGRRGAGAPGRGINIVSVVEIKAKRKGELKVAVDRVRNQVDIVMVNAQDIQVARAAAELPAVDIISHAFVDQPTARDAAANNVALEINLRDILSVYGMKRAILLSKISFNLKLARKYKTPLVFTTGAHSIYDMRTPKQMMMFAESIGFKHEEAKKAVLQTPRKIVETNRKKLSGEIVAKGVKLGAQGRSGAGAQR